MGVPFQPEDGEATTFSQFLSIPTFMFNQLKKNGDLDALLSGHLVYTIWSCTLVPTTHTRTSLHLQANAYPTIVPPIAMAKNAAVRHPQNKPHHQIHNLPLL
jgi:hypothetical protein